MPVVQGAAVRLLRAAAAGTGCAARAVAARAAAMLQSGSGADHAMWAMSQVLGGGDRGNVRALLAG